MMKTIAKKALALLICVIMSITIMTPTTALAATEAELRSKVISIAQGEVGYTASSSYSKYGEWYGYQGAWCTTFVLWCYNQTGQAYGVQINGRAIPSGGNCNSMISWFQNKGTYHPSGDGYTPSAGDLVFFDWSGNGSSQHVGFVSSVSGTTINTIEGNCSGQVKAKQYTKNGSRPYASTSSIMGYATPVFSAVGASGGSSGGSATQAPTKPATTKPPTTTQKPTQTTTQRPTQPQSTTQGTTAHTTTTAPPTTTTTEPTTTTTTTEATTIPLEKLEIFAREYDLKVGDSVKLEYKVAPSGVNAVVGYFCDEEGIIEIGQQGEIKAIGTGTATVVVCANNDLYKQCDFTVTEAESEVTTVAEPESTRKVVDTTNEVVTTERNVNSVLTRMGVNVNALEQHKRMFLVPAGIAAATLVVSLLIAIIKKIKKVASNKKSAKNTDNKE